MGVIAALVHLAFLVVFIIAVVKAFSGVRWEIPYIGPMARKQVEGSGRLRFVGCLCQTSIHRNALEFLSRPSSFTTTSVKISS